VLLRKRPRILVKGVGYFCHQYYGNKNPIGHPTFEEHWKESHDILLACKTVELVGQG